MPKVAIQTEWTAEYDMDSDGDIILSQIECEGFAQQWKTVPDVVDRMLCDEARKNAVEDYQALADEQADLKLLQMKEGD